MRHSIGSAWIFSICLAFIILFTCYLAITINYAKAFRIKSHIVDLIEEYEGYPTYDSENSDKNRKIREEIDSYLLNQGYDASGRCEETIQIPENEREVWNLLKEEGTQLTGNNHRYCIYKRSSLNTEKICEDEAYYKVVVFFKFDLPLIGYLTSFQASGETRLLYDFANGTCRISDTN